jgi:hypothetical protein
MVAHPGVSSETMLQVSCGSNDTFRSNAERYRRRPPDAQGRYQPWLS